MFEGKVANQICLQLMIAYQVGKGYCFNCRLIENNQGNSPDFCKIINSK